MSARVHFICVVCLLGRLAGCDDPGNVGANLIDEQTNVLSTDTLTLKTATVYMDTVVTQASGVVLAGSYQDDYLGRVMAKSYLAFSLEDKAFEVEEDATYDSLTLRLHVGYHYGDSTQVQHLRVHRLAEEITPTDDSDQLYNHNAFAYEPDVLGTFSFKPEMGEDLEIPISGTLGQALFEAAQNEEDIAMEDEAFQDYVKGLVLVNDDASNTAVSGFMASDDDSTKSLVLRLYYTEAGATVNEEQYRDFALSDSYFSQITSERPAPLDQLTTAGTMLPSSQTDERTYVQSGVGMMTRIDFPTIDNLFHIASNHVLVTAFLYVFPVAHTYGKSTPLAQPLVLYVADERNNISAQLVDKEGTTQSATPTIDDEFNAATYYRFDVTAFVQDELDTDRYTGRGLLLSAPSSVYSSSVDRVVLGGSKNRDYRMFLWVVFLPY